MTSFTWVWLAYLQYVCNASPCHFIESPGRKFRMGGQYVQEVVWNAKSLFLKYL